MLAKLGTLALAQQPICRLGFGMYGFFASHWTAYLYETLGKRTVMPLWALKMRLDKEGIELFYRLYHPLLVHTNKKFEIVDGMDSPEDVWGFPLEEINEVREMLYERPELIDSFVNENPLNFTSDELEMVNSWKDFVKGTFYIFRYLKNYTVFLDADEPPKAYGVLALKSPFKEILGPYLPTAVEAVLLPFKDRIIYDSLFLPYPVVFGGGIRRSLNDAYQLAKSRFGMITSLPFSSGEVEQTDADRLRFYLRSQRNRSVYAEEIDDLMRKDESLLKIYHQEMGKVHARISGKRLRKIGVTDAWFAVLDDIIVAGGPTREDVERTVDCILPPKRRDFVYFFQLKKRK